MKDLLLGVLLALAIMLCALAPVRALPLAPMLEVGAQPLAPASCATRNTLWIHHYTAALYVPPKASPVMALEDPKQPKALQVEILNKTFLPREMPKRWRSTLEKELDGRSFGSVTAAWRSLGAGDRVTIAYAPGPGVSLKVNDRLVAATPRHSLVAALLRTFAGDRPVRERVGEAIAKHPCVR